jgi:hypothetical protein
MSRLGPLLCGLCALCVKKHVRAVARHDETANTFLQDRYVEVYQQPELMSRETQVSQDNGFVNRTEALDRFQFDDDAILDQQIQAESAVEFDRFVHERHGFLLFKADAAEGQFVAKALFVRGFEKARAEELVNLDGGANDLAS